MGRNHPCHQNWNPVSPNLESRVTYYIYLTDFLLRTFTDKEKGCNFHRLNHIYALDSHRKDPKCSISFSSLTSTYI